MKTAGNFDRLLGDYERLTRDETFAIHERNFSAVAELSLKKTAVFQELARAGKALGIDHRHATFKDRIAHLIETELQNASLVDECVSKTRCQRQMLATAAKRLRTFERVYGWDFKAEKTQGRFCAAG